MSSSSTRAATRAVRFEFTSDGFPLCPLSLATFSARNRPKRSCTQNVKYVEDYDDEDDISVVPAPFDGDGDVSLDYMLGDESDSESFEEDEIDPLEECDPLEEEKEEEEGTCDTDSDSTDHEDDDFVEQSPYEIDSGVPHDAPPASDEPCGGFY